MRNRFFRLRAPTAEFRAVPAWLGTANFFAEIQSGHIAVRLGLRQLAPGLLHCLLGGGLIGTGRGHSSSAGPGGVVVDLSRHLKFGYQQFVSFKVGLRSHIVGNRLVDLSMCRGTALFGSVDPGVSVFHVGSGEA